MTHLGARSASKGKRPCWRFGLPGPSGDAPGKAPPAAPEAPERERPLGGPGGPRAQGEPGRGHPAALKRADYGIDAPGVVRNLALVGVAGPLLAVVFLLALRPYQPALAVSLA